MGDGKADVGIVGIGVMGGPLTLNMLDKGFVVGIWDVNAEVTEKFAATHAPAYGEGKIHAAKTYEECVTLLMKPRKVIPISRTSPSELRLWRLR
mmetsp:Transcript_91643/g.283463  ORF Transcript_91643/g.283463 Transcript_91643/m.283463 type:complete len:94 (-) Transcript_91643:473-754(-)